MKVWKKDKEEIQVLEGLARDGHYYVGVACPLLDTTWAWMVSRFEDKPHKRQANGEEIASGFEDSEREAKSRIEGILASHHVP